MLLDAELMVGDPGEAPALAKKAEEFGFGCVWINETKHDPFIQLALASASTRTVSLGTSIALAFTRSPVTLAYTTWGLQSLSRGRFILGLGTQVKGHIERRFGLKWDAPAPKMREVVGVLRSVWRTWQTGERLDFEGRFFKVDLMTPFFNPGRIDHPDVPVYIAGVNEGMCRLAGEVGDGLHVHPLHTAKYLNEVVVPAVEVGLRRASRSRKAFTFAASIFAAPGDSREEIDAVKEVYRSQVAFYASTRTYRRLMELHGWGDVCDTLHQLSMKGEWERMPQEITDDILAEFVVEGTWDDIGEAVEAKYGSALDRVRLYLPFDGEERWKRLVGGFAAR